MAIAKGLNGVDTQEIKVPEGTTDLDRMVARQQGEIEKLRQEKEELQNELQLVRLEVSDYIVLRNCSPISHYSFGNSSLDSNPV